MATASPATAGSGPDRVEVRRYRRTRTAAKYTGFGLLGILLLIAAILVWLNTDPGRRYIVRQINNFEAASGLQVKVDSIEGSVFGNLTLQGVRLSDPRGVFFRASEAEIAYRPFAYFRNHIDIRSLTIPQARLHRLPQLRTVDPNAPLLPDIDIDIGRLRIGRLLIDPPVSGQRHLVSLDSRIKISDGRAELGLSAIALRAPGFAGGDRLALRLDAVPEANKLDIALRAQGPGDGFIAGMIGV
ncbi:MAG: intermembrane phospholipid transport protein YdbH family protein, partial [Allosphingosinicella sp.]